MITILKKYNVSLGTSEDLDELTNLYDDLYDYFQSTTNYSGWIKGIYPIRETAEAGINDGTLFLMRENSQIVGSIILNNIPEDAYSQVKWQLNLDYNKILVIRTFVIHPQFLRNGFGKKLLEFAEELAIYNKIKSIRLDVAENNFPAISLYEKIGYKYIGTVDLGLPYEHLKWFKLYEKVIDNKL
ncbi:GNAT family N-acetyltransferase [Fusobacterium sp. PH5-44]|uniref:GNAT family N-acetyltransferase n=1 Tax=unclassified Fusobacterium TaxID=2648384 RepID=UPI003D1D8AF4